MLYDANADWLEMESRPVWPKPLIQLLRNIMAMQEVPRLPLAPSSPKQSRQ